MNQITIEITDKCNLNCKYCYNHWKRPENIQFKELDGNVEILINKILEIPEITRIAFSGGEPFLHSGFHDIIAKMRSKNIGVTIISNGTYATKVDYKKMIDLGVTLFEIPFHSSNSHIHDLMVNKDGAWKKASEIIDFIKSNSGKVIPVIVLTKYNIEGLLDTLQALADKQISQIMMNRYNIGGEGVINPMNILPSYIDLNRAFSIANDFTSKTKIKISSNVCLPWCVIAPMNFPAIRFGNCSNDIDKMPVTVDSRGNIRICNHSPVIVGNIFEIEFSKIFQSKYIDDWKNIIPKHCIICELWKYCKGGCRAAAEQEGTSINEVDPILKYYELL